MTHSPYAEFQQKIEDFLIRTDMAVGRFGELACNDRGFVADLRAGKREFKPSTIEKVEKWMAGFDFGAAHTAAKYTAAHEVTP